MWRKRVRFMKEGCQEVEQIGDKQTKNHNSYTIIIWCHTSKNIWKWNFLNINLIPIFSHKNWKKINFVICFVSFDFHYFEENIIWKAPNKS